MSTFKYDQADEDLITTMYDPQLVELLLPVVTRAILARRLGATAPADADHRDGNRYNLCRSNLICVGAHKDSISGVKGIGWDKARSAYIVGSKRFTLLSDAVKCLLTGS